MKNKLIFITLTCLVIFIFSKGLYKLSDSFHEVKIGQSESVIRELLGSPTFELQTEDEHKNKHFIYWDHSFRIGVSFDAPFFQLSSKRVDIIFDENKNVKEKQSDWFSGIQL